MCVFDVIDHSGKYDAEYERQMQQMKATLHSQAVSFILQSFCVAVIVVVVVSFSPYFVLQANNNLIIIPRTIFMVLLS